VFLLAWVGVGAGGVLLWVNAAASEASPPETPPAVKALEHVLLKTDFGAFKFEKHEIEIPDDSFLTPGLRGILVANYRSAEGEHISVYVQWFDDRQKLLSYFNTYVDQRAGFFERSQFEGVGIISIHNDSWYLWSDGQQFMVTVGGAPMPAEMIRQYLQAIPSKVTEIAEARQANRPDELEAPSTP